MGLTGLCWYHIREYVFQYENLAYEYSPKIWFRNYYSSPEDRRYSSPNRRGHSRRPYFDSAEPTRRGI